MLFWRGKNLFGNLYIWKDQHSFPSYKQRPYKERLVDFQKTKEQRLVDFKTLKERVP